MVEGAELNLGLAGGLKYSCAHQCSSCFSHQLDVRKMALSLTSIDQGGRVRIFRVSAKIAFQKTLMSK